MALIHLVSEKTRFMDYGRTDAGINSADSHGPWRSAGQLQLVLHWQFSADLYKENSLLKTKTIEFWANSHTVLTDESSEPPRV